MQDGVLGEVHQYTETVAFMTSNYYQISAFIVGTAQDLTLHTSNYDFAVTYLQFEVLNQVCESSLRGFYEVILKIYGGHNCFSHGLDRYVLHDIQHRQAGAMYPCQLFSAPRHLPGTLTKINGE